jgi:hypothetical protein
LAQGDNEAVGWKRVLLVTLSLCVLATAVWQLRRTADPVYQGKTLTAWLRDLEQWDGDTNDAAFVAFRDMRTNAIPILLETLETGGSRWKTQTLRFNQRQSIVRLPNGEPWHETTAASWALYAMGTNARSALPALTNLLFHSNSVIASAVALAGIGSAAVPSLLAALTNENDRIRHSACLGLGWEREDLNLVIPALLNCLHDTNDFVRLWAVHSLGHLHAQPEVVVTTLLKNYEGANPTMRGSLLISLGLFGTNANSAIPLVIEALKDDNESVRSSAAFALRQIDEAAAAAHGIK